MKANQLNINFIQNIGHDRFVLYPNLMSLLDTVNKLGHYAKKGVKAVTKPVNLLIAGVALSTLVSTQEVQSQVKADTLWGTGYFVTKMEQGSPLPHVDLSVTPIYIETITPDTTYTFNTGLQTISEFELPTYIDTVTTTQEHNKQHTNVQVFPTIGSELNAFFPHSTNGQITIVNVLGQQVQSQEIHGDHAYLSLEKLATGPYLYVITTPDNQTSGKFIKQPVPLQGASPRHSHQPELPSNNFKNSTFQDFATYKVKWEKEGFLTDSTEIDIYTGENPSFFFYLQEPEPLPDHQDFIGVVKDGNNELAPMGGITVLLEHTNTGEWYMKTTNEQGEFMFEDLPVRHVGDPQQKYYLHVGGDTSKYAFSGIRYLAPTYREDEWLASDTINDNFDVVLMDKIPTTSANHIRDQTSNGLLMDTVDVYLGDSYTATQKNFIRNTFTMQENAEGNVYVFREVFEELNGTGINFEYGTYNTTPTPTGVVTPLHDTLYPILYSNVTMGTGYPIIQVHEVKQALGFDPVGWPSVLNANPQVYTQEDKDIAQYFERPYWNYVYKDSATWVDANTIVEDIDDKLEQAQSYFTKQNKSIPANIKIPEYSTPPSTSSEFEITYDYE